MADFEILDSENFYGYKFNDEVFFDLYIEHFNFEPDLTLEKLKSIKKLSDSLTEKAKNKFMVQKKQLSAKEKAE